MGFTACEEQGGLFMAATEAIRKEAERTDFLRSFVMLGSLGGGTGSGTGSALLQHLMSVWTDGSYVGGGIT